MTYHDFEIWARVGGQPGSYAVSVTNSSSGSASNVMHLDLASSECQNLLPVVMSGAEDAAKREEFGQFLFRCLFDGAVRDAWTESVGRARGVADQGIRLRLWLDAPELAVLPWELLHDGVDFLAVSRSVVVSRFLPAGEPPAFVTPEKARVLVIIQEPPDRPILPDVPAQLEAALKASARFAAPKVLRNSTLSEINSELSNGYEALHYMGHGAPDKLLLATDKEVRIQDGREFAALFTGQASLQLIVLNVCASGATTTRGVFSGLGPLLAEKRLPAVVAMQYNSVAQRTAAEFNTAFYDALGRSRPVDVAVNSARLSVLLNHSGERDWSTPVLYMTTRTGRVLEFVDSPAQAAARAAELAREQAQREAAVREATLALGEIETSLRFLERSTSILNVARGLRHRLNSLPQPLTVADWKQVRQAELTNLQSEARKLPGAQNAAWLQLALAKAQELASSLANANYGWAAGNLAEMDMALGDGIAELENSNEAALRECQARSARALASFRVE